MHEGEVGAVADLEVACGKELARLCDGAAEVAAKNLALAGRKTREKEERTRGMRAPSTPLAS